MVLGGCFLEYFVEKKYCCKYEQYHIFVFSVVCGDVIAVKESFRNQKLMIAI